MAFKPATSSSSGNTPFFAEWIKELTEPFISFLEEKQMYPKRIKAVESGKGYMLNFDDEFSIFLWKRSSIGKLVKRMIEEEQGNLLLIQFTKTKKGLNYEIGFDDEVEVAVSEDKHEEGVFYLEDTNETTIPIAPDDYRTSGMSLPIQNKPKPVEFKTSSLKKPKPTPRSDGDSVK